MRNYSIIIRKTSNNRQLAANPMIEINKQKLMNSKYANQSKAKIQCYIEALYNAAIKGFFTGKPKKIGRLTSLGKTFLESLSGLKLKQTVSFVLNPSDLCHIHNNHVNEKDIYNNIPLNIKDIKNMINVLMYPDIILYFNDKNGRKSFYFLKDITNGTYNIDEIYANRNGNLTLKTMYKTKKSADQRVIDLKSLLSTSETYSVAYSSDTKIPILFECAIN